MNGTTVKIYALLVNSFFRQTDVIPKRGREYVKSTVDYFNEVFEVINQNHQPLYIVF
jgi:hypothetical protein